MALAVKSLNSGNEANRFKFRSFADRIDSININVAHRIQKYDIDDLGENKSYFTTALESWRELNLTTHFVSFNLSIRNNVHTLTQIAFHKQKLVDSLVDFIRRADELSLEPLLDLVTKLAHDLGGDFMPFYEDILLLLSSLISSKKPEIIEWTFNCVAFLFKYLSKHLVEDLVPTLRILSPLLGLENQRKHIQTLISEALAFLVRKTRGPKLEQSLEALFNHLVTSTSSEQHIIGCTQVIVETLKGVNRQFYSRAPQILGKVLPIALKRIKDDSELDQQPAFDVIRKMSIALVHFTNREHYGILLDVYFEHLEAAMEKPNNGNDISILCSLLSISATVRKGSRISNRIKFAQLTAKLSLMAFSDMKATNILKNEVLKLIEATLYILPGSEGDFSASSLFRRVLTGDNLTYACRFLVDMKDWREFGNLLLGPAVKFMDSFFAKDPTSIVLLCHILTREVYPQTGAGIVTLGNRIKFGATLTSGVLNSISTDISWFEEEAMLEKLDIDACSIEETPKRILMTAIAIDISQKIIITHDKLKEKMECLFQSLLKTVNSSITGTSRENMERSLTEGDPHVLVHHLLGHVMTTMASESKHSKEAHAAFSKFTIQVKDLIEKFSTSGPILAGAFCFLDHFKDVNLSDGTVQKLRHNVSHFLRDVRLNSLRLLQLSSTSESDQELVDLAIQVDVDLPTVDNLRKKVLNMQRLTRCFTIASSDISNREIAPRLAISLYGANFAPLWKEATKSLAIMAQVDSKAVWDVVHEQFANFDDNHFLTLSKFQDAVMTAFQGDSAIPRANNLDRNFDCTNLYVVEGLRDRHAEYFTQHQAKKLCLQFIAATKGTDDVPRIDFHNIYLQLVTALNELSEVAEQHSRFIVPLFLRLLEFKFAAFLDHDKQLPVDDEADDMNPGDANKCWMPRGVKEAKLQLRTLLTLFGKFKNPKALYASQRLYGIFMRMIAQGDTMIQRLALECVFTWNAPAIVPYMDNLRNLVDDTKFRDELSVFALDTEATSISKEHRSEVMQIVIRLLYGRMLSRSGKSSAKTGMAARRVAVLTSISGCTDQELDMFLDLMMDRISTDTSMRAQIGYLTLQEDVLSQLASRLSRFINKMVTLVIWLSSKAQLELSNTMEIDVDPNDGEVRIKQLRQVRQLGLRCISMIFTLESDYDFTPHLPAVFEELISPRLKNFAVENSQTPSALFGLFKTWVSTRRHAFNLVSYEPRLLDIIFTCLEVPNVSIKTTDAVLDIVNSLIMLSESEMTDEHQSAIASKVLAPHVTNFLRSMTVYLKTSKAMDIGKDENARRQIAILSSLASYVKGSDQAVQLLDFLLPQLRAPSRSVPEQTKGDILKLFAAFIPMLEDFQPSNPLYTRYYRLVSSLFSTLSSRSCRLLLVQILTSFCEIDPEIKGIVQLVADMNAYSEKRLDVPDFDRRIDAFVKVNEELYISLTPHCWMPVLYNCVFYANDAEEMSVRSNAAYGLRRFIDAMEKTVENRQEYENLFLNIVYVGIKKAMKSSSEMVRDEFVQVLSHAAEKLSSLPQLTSLVHLLFGGDEEVNFFKNIYHIQMHRRLRAMRRLAEVVSQGKLDTQVLSNILLPLLQHYVLGDKTYDHTIVNEAVHCIGAVSGQFPWGPYYRLLRTYMSLLEKKRYSEKVLVRAISNVLDNFHFSLQADDVELTHKVEDEDYEIIECSDHEDTVKALDTTKIAMIVSGKLLPALDTLLKNREELDVLHRVPMAFSIVKLIKLLPENLIRETLAGTLTTTCHILRSRSVEARDATRATLLKITKFLGPSFFSFIVREMKGALQRGYQLHVLGYSVHHLLANIADELQVGDLDYCLQELIEIMVNDTFSEIGAEKEAEEYTSKMREMKRNKSYSSFEIVTKLTSFSKLTSLLMPLKDVMRESGSTNVLKKVDEVLRRISIGVNSSTKFDTKAVLIFCHGIITQNINFVKPTKESMRPKTQKELNFEVAMKRDSHLSKDYFPPNAYKFVQFALLILCDGLRRGKFDGEGELHLQETISMFDPFVEAVGDCIFSKHQSVVIAAMKVLCIIVKYPLPSLEDGLPILLKQTLTIVKEIKLTKSETVQACFRFLTVLLRDKDGIKVKDEDMVFLVQLIKADLEEPERQSVTFSLIRAMMSRRFTAPEVYDLVDEIGEIMITNQAPQVRELCRNVYLQFLLDYPQSKGRLKDQMTFLAKNLSYTYASGRESTMEMINQILMKFGDEILQEHIEKFFVSLAMVLVNDEDSRSREMAATLIKSLVQRADSIRSSRLYAIQDKWLEAESSDKLQRLAVQIYGLLGEASGKSNQDLALKILPRLKDMIREGHRGLEDHDIEIDENINWETTYYSLKTVNKILQIWPDFITKELDLTDWEMIVELLVFPHAWIRLSACRLLGLFLSNFDTVTMICKKNASLSLTLDTLINMARKLCLQLQSRVLSEELALQNIKNLVFIAKCFASIEERVQDVNGKLNEDLDLDVNDGNEEVDNDKNNSTLLNTAPLRWLINKLSWQARYVSPTKLEDEDERSAARKVLTLQRSYIFKALAGIINVLHIPLVLKYCRIFIEPLNRIESDETLRGEGVEEVKNLAREVLSLLKSKTGTTAYVTTFEQIQRRVTARREARKEAKVIQTMNDPAAAARRKVQKSTMKTQNRKRKAREYMREKTGISGLKRVRGVPNV